MTDRNVCHAVFTLERTYPAAPARVFKAFADIDAKARWFVGPPGWKLIERTLDFRIGGRERAKGSFEGGVVTDYQAVFQDIVPDERIIYSYGMHLDDRRISVSLATVEFKPAGSGTTLILTEQGTFLDGYDDSGSREQGTADLLDKLGAALAQAEAA
jgi:uncharacterized protein YndB with AHSA1/START domain